MLALCFGLAGNALAAAVAAASPATPVVVRSDVAGTVLEFVAELPVIHAGPHGDRVEIDGYLPLAGPAGAPLLPGRTVLVAVPAGSSVRHRTQVEAVRTIAGVRPQPLSSPVRTGASGRMSPTDPLPAVVESFVEQPTWFGPEGRPYPAAHVQVSEVMRLRNVDVVSVTVIPAQFDPTLPGLRLAGRLRVTIETSGGILARSIAGPLAGADRDFYASSVINPAVVAGFRHAVSAPAPAPPGPRAVGFGSASQWVKLGVGRRGLILLSGAELADADVAIATIDPATLRIFWGGGRDPEPGISARSSFSPSFMTECAIRVVDQGVTGELDAADTILWAGNGASGWLDDFTGTGFDIEYVEHQAAAAGCYWLTWGVGDFGTEPARMTTRAAAPESGASTITSGRARVHWEQNRLYNPDFYEKDVKWEKWWYSTTIYDQAPPVTIPINTPQADPTVPGQVRARLWGRSIMGDVRGHPPGGIHDHYVQAFWNGELLHTPAGADTFIWDGADGTRWPGRQDIEAADLLFQSSNELVLDALTIDDPDQQNRVDESLLAWYQVSYTRHLQMNGETWIEFATPTGTEGTVNFAVTGAPAGALLFDVTDPYGAVPLTGEQQGTTLRFSATLTGSAVRKFWVGGVGAYAGTVSIAIDRSFPDLRSTANRARYVVIAHDSLIEPARRLAAAHVTLPLESTPAMSMVVRVSDIYDEFGWGLKSCTAIRNFVDYAVHLWEEDGRPLYICLLGDASYDPLDFYGAGTALTDLVPAPSFWNYIGGSYSGSDFISDDWYVRTFGTELETPTDQLTDLYVGRLPARSLGEAEVIVDQKTIPFIQHPILGPWRQRVLLAADDEWAGERNEGYRHVRNSEDVAGTLPAELERVKVYLHDFPLDEIGVKPEARAAFLASFDAGAALVNYIGHGAPDVLAHEALFRVEHTGQLGNGGRLPFFFTFSCTVNRFDEPGSEGIGEALVKHPNGGSVISIGSTDLAFIGSNQRLNKGTFSRLWIDEAVTDRRSIGAALGAAKNDVAGALALGAGATAFSDTANARKYVLLGDPALTISTPDYRVLLDAAEVSGGAGRDTLTAGVPYVLSGEVVDTTHVVLATARGEVVVRVIDSDEIRHRSLSYLSGFPVQGADVFRSTLPLAGGRLETSFVVPLDAYQSETGARGMGGLRAYASGAFGDACGAREVFLDVLSAAGADTVGPAIVVEFETEPDVVLPGGMLYIRVADESGINIVGNTPSNALFMRIDEELTLVLNDLFSYTPGSATEGSIDFQLPELAAGSHVARIHASDNFLNRSSAEVEFSVVVPGELKLYQAFLYPNPFDPGDRRGTVLGFELRERAEVTVRVLTVSGRLIRERFDELEAEDHLLEPGRHQIRWDGRDEDGDFAANGVYLLKISARGELTGERTSTMLRSIISR